MKSLTAFAAILISGTLVFMGCGDDSVTNPQDNTHLLSGTVQGEPLSLTNQVTTFAGSPGEHGSTNGTGSAARFDIPYLIATDGSNLYLSDYQNQTIRKIVIATRAVTTFAGSPGQVGFADGTGTAARFHGPSGVTTDGVNVYVTDMDNHVIRRISIATGEVTTIAGSPGQTGSADGIGSAARFNGPEGLGMDEANLYVSDSGNFTIRKIEIATGEVTTIAGSPGQSGFADGVGAEARFLYPETITTDGTALYLPDSENRVIRRVEIATGEVTTIAGSPGQVGSTDGTGSAARFNRPIGITTDGVNLYVSDADGYTVRKVVIATGEVTTIAGSPGEGGTADGTGSAARFDYPGGSTTDGKRLFVCDLSNSTIRAIR
jgi:hypothetical protein